MGLGVTLIDMGGGTTSLAVFYDGQLVPVAVVPMGGAHVTNDIARGLSTPLAPAPRLQTLYGPELTTTSAATETLAVPHVGDPHHNSPHHVPRPLLPATIHPPPAANNTPA